MRASTVLALAFYALGIWVAFATGELLVPILAWAFGLAVTLVSDIVEWGNFR